MIRHDMNSMMAVARPSKIISCSTLFFPARCLEGGAPKGKSVRLTRLNNCGEMVFPCGVWGLQPSRATRPSKERRVGQVCVIRVDTGGSRIIKKKKYKKKIQS